VRRKGSHGGQKGLKSIQECLGTEDYQRIKIGVGAKPHPDYDMAAWVLSNFDAKDIEAISENYPRIYDGLCRMLEGNTEEAMQICNKK
jgi:PTH1 family peptidyl-tRNA hydrolase